MRFRLIQPFVSLALMVLALPAAAQQTHNRSLENLIIRETGGEPQLRILYGLEVTDNSSDELILDAEIDVLLNGRVIDTIAANATKPASAITCAATCAGSCPSILGAGICSGCGCVYNNWLTTALGGASTGDEIMVLLRPAPGALPESDTSDDNMMLIYEPSAAVPSLVPWGTGVLVVGLTLTSLLSLRRRRRTT